MTPNTLTQKKPEKKCCNHLRANTYSQRSTSAKMPPDKFKMMHLSNLKRKKKEEKNRKSLRIYGKDDKCIIFEHYPHKASTMLTKTNKQTPLWQNKSGKFYRTRGKTCILPVIHCGIYPWLWVFLFSREPKFRCFEKKKTLPQPWQKISCKNKKTPTFSTYALMVLLN